jgi:hypothetical protein
LKQLILLAAFCLLGNLVFSQQPYAAALEKYPKIARAADAAEESRKQVAERDNANLRLDSTTDYSAYFAGDSSRTGYSLYAYPSAGTTVTDFYYRDFLTQAFQLNSRRINTFDALERLTLLEQYTFNNGTPALSFQVLIFWRGNSLRELDSVKVFSVSSGTSIIKDHVYNANHDELRRREYYLDASGGVTGVSEFNNTYQADGRLERSETRYGSSIANLLPTNQGLFTYNADSTKQVSEYFDGLEWTTFEITYSIHLPNEPDLMQKRFSYLRDDASQSFYLVSSVLSEFDAEKRIVARLFFNQSSLTAIPTLSLQRYAYRQENDYDFTTYHSVDIPTGDATLLARTVYHYTDVSATRSPLLSPDAVKVMPNPAHDVVRLDAGERDILTVEMLDAAGRLVRSASFAQPVATLETAGLPRGMVTLRVVTRDGVVAKSVVLE